MYQKKNIISKILVALFLFSLLPLPTVQSLSYDEIWDIQITNIQTHDTLETHQQTTLYGGETQLTTFLDTPSKATDHFLLIELKVDKIENANSTFDGSTFSLSLENNTYPSQDATFLYEHNLTPFPKSEIQLGTTYGYILFEIPKSSDYSNATLIGKNFQSPLKLYDQTANHSNIPIIDNTFQTQAQTQEDILDLYNLGSYTLAKPYILQNPYGNAPLSALILFDTTLPASVSIEIQGKSEYTSISHTFTDDTTFHQIPIVGLYPDYANQVHLTLTYVNGIEVTVTHTIQTPALENHRNLLEPELISSTPEKMAEGLTFLEPTGYMKFPMAIDCDGEIRWILTTPALQNLTRLENGNLLSLLEYDNQLTEFDLLGKYHNMYFDPNAAHHDVIQLTNGNLLTTSSYQYGYMDDRLIELDIQTGDILWDYDLKEILDPTRFNADNEGDWIHINSIYFDESDQSLIISGRHQGVFKISYPQGNLIWMLTIDAELDSLQNSYLTPLNDTFKAPYSQHAAMVLPDQDNNPNTLDLILFDNNLSYNTMPIGEYDQEYSRMVQYRIHETEMTVEEIWSFGETLGYEYFGDIVGDADYLPNGNTLSTFGRRNFILDQSGTDTSTIFEVDPTTNEILFQLDIHSQNAESIYRSDRLPLYPSEWLFSLETPELSPKNRNPERMQVYTQSTPIQIPTTDNLMDTYVEATFNEMFNTLDIKGTLNFSQPETPFTSASLIIQSDAIALAFPLEKQALHNYIFSYYVCIPFDILSEQLPPDSYTLGFLLENEEISSFQSSNYYFTVVLGDSIIKTVDILETQNKISQSLQSDFQTNSYTLQDPLLTIDPFQISPLSALALFETTSPAKITVTIDGQNNGQIFTNTYTQEETSHQIPIYGLYETTETTVTLTATYQDGSTETNSFPLQGNPLPTDFSPSQVIYSDPLQMADGLTFYSDQTTTHYFYGIDYTGDVRFLLNLNGAVAGGSMELLDNGNLLILSDKTTGTLYYKESLLEIDFTGKIFTEYLHNGIHHEAIQLQNGNILLAGNTKDGSVLEDAIYEIHRTTGNVLGAWDADDFFPVDEYDQEGTRASAEVFSYNTHDWLHINALDEHPQTGDILISARNQHAVLSLNPTTSELNYIISDHTLPLPDHLEDKRLTPIGDNFFWQYGQHDAKFLPNGDILLFDNGSFRSRTYENQVDAATQGFSSINIYRVDETNMTIEMIWTYGEDLGPEFLSAYLSSVQYLGENHYFINFGGILLDADYNPTYLVLETWISGYSKAIQIELKDNEVIFQTQFSDEKADGNVYRAKRINLYNSQSSPDYFQESIRLGNLTSYQIASKSSLPTNLEELELYTVSVIDNGVQLEYDFQMKNGYQTGENYLYFVSDSATYQVPLNTGTNISGVINKIELPDDEYDLYLQNNTLLTDLNLIYGATSYQISYQSTSLGVPFQSQFGAQPENATTLPLIDEPTNSTQISPAFFLLPICFFLFFFFLKKTKKP